MEGLEISVLSLSEVLSDNKIFRIDSEFQLKEYIETLNKVKQVKNFTLNSQLELLTDGKHGGVTLTKEGVAFLRTTNIKENEIDLSDKRFISEEESEETLRAEFKKDDLLLTTIGTIGLCAKVPKNFPRATINQNLVRIVLKDKKKSSFICCFLNSKYGKNQLLRFGAGNVYQMINYPNLKKVLIPYFKDLVNSIDNLYLDAEYKRIQSKQTYAQAENILLAALGLIDFTPSQEAVNIKSFSASFGTSGRLDAEYYQPKYELLEKAFNNFKRITLSNLVNYPISSGITPKAGGNAYTNSKKGIPFVRAVDLRNGEVITSNFKFLKQNIHNGILKRTQLKKDDVLLSIAGTVGRSSLFNHNFEANINQAVSILRFDESEIKRLYLVSFFNSSIGKIFISKYSRQGVQTNLSLTEIGNLSIPIINYDKQQQIAELIEKSFALKKQSEHLLAVAKTAVEMAIEQKEEVAMEYINNETK